MKLKTTRVNTRHGILEQWIDRDDECAQCGRRLLDRSRPFDTDYYATELGAYCSETCAAAHADDFEVLQPAGVLEMATPIVLDRPKTKRCAICKCDATAERYGFSVCAWHVMHGEDGPMCPVCEFPKESK